jgi:DNA repair photolyase
MGKSDVSCSNFGTKEWAAKNANIITGCIHNCSYCYARASAARFKRVAPGEWHKEVIRSEAGKKRYKKYDKPVMYPTAHDISVKNLDASITEIRNILKPGNLVLIVSKPHLVCIKKICEEFKEQKDNILFRFSIGSADDKVLKFWEEFAPKFSERLESLKWAHKEGFSTSVSCEPMLDDKIDKVISSVSPYVTDKIWIGKANHFLSNLRHNQCDDNAHIDATNKLKGLQSNERIKKLYEKYKGDVKIAWKESIKKVVGLQQTKEQQEEEMMGGFNKYQNGKGDKVANDFDFDDVDEMQRAWDSLGELGNDVLMNIGKGQKEGLKISVDELLTYENSAKAVDWDDIVAKPLSNLLDHTNVGKPVKFVARIVTLGDPTPVRVGSGKKLRTQVTATLKGTDGTEVKCFPVFDNGFRQQLVDQRKLSSYSVYCGIVYPKFVANTAARYMFSIRRIKEQVTANDLISLRPELADQMNNLMKEIDKKPGDILKYIKSTLVSRLGIVGLDQATEINTCIDFMILQSLSDGFYQNYPLKLHSLVIGPPANGKKLLVEIAEILNPVFNHASGINGKLTAAGLVGKTVVKDGVSTSSPGLIPLASGGALAIEDFHGIKNNRGGILSALAETMEDGTVNDSTSAKTKHKAETSIHLDMNRLSQIDPTAKVSKSDDVNIFTNVISRFDFVMDIPQSRKKTIEVAMKMLKGEKTVTGSGGRVEDDKWKRELKVLVAHLRTYWHTITITKEMSDYMTRMFEKIVDANKLKYKEFAEFYMLEANAVRMAHSIIKMCVASARARRVYQVERVDVDRAFDFIVEKLKFLQTYEKYLDVPDYSSDKVDTDKEIRQKAIRKEFGEKTTSVDKILEYLQKNSTTLNVPDITKKTVYDDLKEIKARRVKKGIWQVPKLSPK